MQTLVSLWHQLADLEGLIRTGGYLGLTAIIFAETGLLVGFFLPGDSLLVTAGLLASQGVAGIDVYTVGALLSVAAIAGNTVGYYLGRAAGHTLFTRENSLLFRREHLHRAHAFYERHGGKTLVLARFMPIVRTFVPVVAGAADMDVRAFTLYNVAGGLAWIWTTLLIGYFLGRIPAVRAHIELLIVGVIALSLLPGIIGWLRRDHPDRSETRATD
jgi:membrane-associated protein